MMHKNMYNENKSFGESNCIAVLDISKRNVQSSRR